MFKTIKRILSKGDDNEMAMKRKQEPEIPELPELPEINEREEEPEEEIEQDMEDEQLSEDDIEALKETEEEFDEDLLSEHEMEIENVFQDGNKVYYLKNDGSWETITYPTKEKATQARQALY